MMPKRKGLIEEFWEASHWPFDTKAVLKEFFDEFANFVNPQSYGADGILKSVVKMFAEFIK
jgi:hypothetical protein